MQPGKPLAFGRVCGAPVIGLPGNPVSALVTFELFAATAASAPCSAWRATAAATCRATRDERDGEGPARRAYLRVRVGATRTAGSGAAGRRPGLVAAATDGRSANALLIVPEGQPAAEAGATYEAILLGARRMTTASHLGPGGEPRMVDVGGKPVTARRAVAGAIVRMRPEALATLLDAGGPKGDAFVAARLAGIGAREADVGPHPALPSTAAGPVEVS